MRKVVKLAEAVGRIPDGAVSTIGGFLGACTPACLIDEKRASQGKISAQGWAWVSKG